MKFHEIADRHPITAQHPYSVVISIHPSLWSQLRRFVKVSPDDFCLADKIEPTPDNWIAHVKAFSDRSESEKSSNLLFERESLPN